MIKPGRPSQRGRRVTIRLLAAAVAAGLVVALPVGIASAAKKPRPTPVGVTFTGGCKGQGAAKKANGKILDSATAPEAPGATSSDPLDVARGGAVDWSGSTPVVFSDHHWWIHLDGFPIRSGGSPNASHEKAASGVVKVDSYLPSWLGLTGTYYVNGEISGVGGTCSGAVYVHLTGDPATGLLLWAGIVLVLAGALLLLGSRPNWLTVLRVAPATSPLASTPQTITSERTASGTTTTPPSATEGGGT